MSDIKRLKSHPNKLLLEHIEGVRRNVRKLTNSPRAELVAIFHDFGKINPYFQNKIIDKEARGYSKHSYLSAYILFCTCGKYINEITSFLNYKVSANEVLGLIAIIAKHHGNLPNFSISEDSYLLQRLEIDELFHFFDENDCSIIEDLLDNYLSISSIVPTMRHGNIRKCFKEKLYFDYRKTPNGHFLDFFLDIQNTFACLLYADKADAANYDDIIDVNKKKVDEFAEIFKSRLDSYLCNLNQDTALNVLRTQIRLCSNKNIRIGLNDNKRVFELTAPTGSGKTLMLLSLASEIIKYKGGKRIIYSIPFLSITEQVESEILKVFVGYEDFIQRIDSKSENKRLDEKIASLEGEPADKNYKEFGLLTFMEDTFAYPLVITTFVRFFETLLSNKNSELLKLPNFSNCIFLIDEIQALPPRLYGFFVAYLTKFSEKFDSYAIISTATQPNFNLPSTGDKVAEIKEFFDDYIRPYPLLPSSYFNNELFNRYKIHLNMEVKWGMDELAHSVLSKNSSVLVILNTIADTKDLFESLKTKLAIDEIILLNTHFIPDDRMTKIKVSKQRLKEGKRVILISTQLIEAGVDIDFPIVYRDMATLPSIIQSAGRCNRNGKLAEKGNVHLFCFVDKNGRKRHEFIYGEDKPLLNYTKDTLSGRNLDYYEEKELLNIQQSFFKKIQSELNWGYYGKNCNFVDDITNCMYEKIGKFRLIDEQSYGTEHKYYVSKNENDIMFEDLLSKQDELITLLNESADIGQIKYKKKEIELHLKSMANRIVTVRLKADQTQPLLGDSRDFFGLYKIDKSCYSFIEGVIFNTDCII